MQGFIDNLLTFNPYWLVGALLFGFFVGRTVHKWTMIFMIAGYVSFVYPTMRAADIARSLGISSELAGYANSFGITPWDLHSALVAAVFILVSSVFWALNQRSQL